MPPSHCYFITQFFAFTNLSGAATVEAEHVAEAVRFRGLERLVEGRKMGKAATRR